MRLFLGDYSYEKFEQKKIKEKRETRRDICKVGAHVLSRNSGYLLKGTLAEHR